MTQLRLQAVGARHEHLVLDLARAFHAEDGHPLTDRGAEAIRMALHGHPRARIWLLQEGAQTVGYAVLGLGFGVEYGGPDAFVDDLYLIPAARGRRLGSTALQLLEAEARALGLRALFLVVDPDNRPARQAYDRAGFEPTPWLTMVKRL
jgi:ribosomal protein S18 acetylase RimI-like enzyme